MSPNPYQNVNAYSKNQKAQPIPEGNSRDIDARALLVCANKLNDSKTLLEVDPRSRENLKIYGEAIRFNQRLWTIFQIAVSDAGNPLPDQLKLILLNLSRYVDKTSFSAIGKYRPDLIDSLININRMIASGLSKQQTGEATAQPAYDTRDIPTSLMTSA